MLRPTRAAASKTPVSTLEPVAPEASGPTPPDTLPPNLTGLAPAPRPIFGHPATWVAQAQGLLRQHARPVAAVLLGTMALGVTGCATTAPFPRSEPPMVQTRPAPALDLHHGEPDNLRRGERARARLRARVAADPAVAARLTPRIDEALTYGVEARRAPDRGLEGILGVGQLDGVLTATAALSAEDFGALTTALDAAGGEAPRADPRAERALILEALGVRGRGGRVSSDAFEAVLAFATEIRGLARDELLRTTTGLDLWAANTSIRAPSALLGADTVGDNDGLYQRWGDACGPTVGQLVRSEADPIYARALHRTFDRIDPRSGGGAEQAAVLEAAGAPTAPRIARQTLFRIEQDLRGAGSPLSRAEQRAMTRWIRGDEMRPRDEAALAGALETLRARHGGAPNPTAVAALRGDVDAFGVGMVLRQAFLAVAGDALGRRFEEVEIGPEGLLAHLPDIDRRLRDGEDIPIRADGVLVGHAMLLADVRGEGAAKAYLIADPWTGRTAWASQADLVSGRFTQDVLQVPGLERVTHFYVD